MPMMQRDLVIVGAGPAGMAAAIAACRAGSKVTLIDENHAIGGQIYRQSPAALSGLSVPTDTNAAHGKRLIDELESLKEQIEWLPQTSVWGYFPDRKLAVRMREGWQIITAQQVILATGAYEYVAPFPGWTLPGVMTPGGAQSMLKGMKVLPGNRILIAGSGPFLLVVAALLHAAGGKVVGVVETARRRDALTHLPALLSNPKLLLQGRYYFKQLRKARIPLHWGHVVTRADGAGSLERLTISACDSAGKPCGNFSTVDVDTLCVGYGFIPRTELTQMTRCEMEYQELLGGWIPRLDQRLSTSASGIRVAGDGGGVAGAMVAELEGAVAGLTASHALGDLTDKAYKQQITPLTRRLRKSQTFRMALDRIYQIRPGLLDLACPDTTICRCEEISRKEMEDGIQFGGTNISTLKVITRIGMGPCQGKMCWPTVSRMIAKKEGKSVAEIGNLRVRPPISPINMSDLLNESFIAESSESS